MTITGYRNKTKRMLAFNDVFHASLTFLNVDLTDKQRTEKSVFIICFTITK